MNEPVSVTRTDERWSARLVQRLVRLFRRCEICAGRGYVYRPPSFLGAWICPACRPDVEGGGASGSRGDESQGAGMWAWPHPSPDPSRGEE